MDFSSIKIQLELTLGFILILFHSSYSQTIEPIAMNNPDLKEITQDYLFPFNMDEQFPSTSLFVELGGRIYYTVNVDYRWNERYSSSFGICVVEGVFANILFSRYFGRKHRIETGLGCEWLIFKDGIPGMFAQGLVGYRYQKKKGLIFRAGVYGLLGIPYRPDGRVLFAPLPGVSLGYSF